MVRKCARHGMPLRSALGYIATTLVLGAPAFEAFNLALIGERLRLIALQK